MCATRTPLPYLSVYLTVPQQSSPKAPATGSNFDWILNDGDCHVSTQKSFFETYRTIPFSKIARGSNGEGTQVLGIGTVLLNVRVSPDSTITHHFPIHNVYHVDSGIASVLSLRKLQIDPQHDGGLLPPRRYHNDPQAQIDLQHDGGLLTNLSIPGTRTPLPPGYWPRHVQIKSRTGENLFYFQKNRSSPGLETRPGGRPGARREYERVLRCQRVERT